MYVPRKHTNIMKQILRDIPIKNQKDIEIKKIQEEITNSKIKINNIKNNLDYYTKEFKKNQVNLENLIAKMEKLKSEKEKGAN